MNKKLEALSQAGLKVPSPEDLKKMEKYIEKYKNSLNAVYATDNGKFLLQSLVRVSGFWGQASQSMNELQKSTLIAQQDFIKQWLFRYLTRENTADIIHATTKGAE